MPKASDIKHCLSFEKPKKWSFQRGNIWQYYGELVTAVAANIYGPIDTFLHYSMRTIVDVVFVLFMPPAMVNNQGSGCCREHLCNS